MRSVGRADRPWALADRLSQVQVQDIAESFIASVAQRNLAERYGISMSSAKRLLREQRR